MIYDNNKSSLIRFLKEIKPDPRVLNRKTDYYNKHLLIKGTDPRDLFIYPVSLKKIKIAEEGFINILSAMEKFARYVIFQDNSLLKIMKIQRLDIEGITKRGGKYLFSYSRIDSIFDGKKYQVLEVNARRPQIYEDTDWYSEYLKSELGEKLTNVDKVSSALAESIRQGYDLNTSKEPEIIILVSGFIKHLARKIKSNFVDSIKRVFPVSKVIILDCDGFDILCSALKLSGEKAVYKNRSVDLIIMQDECDGKNNMYLQGGIRNKVIARAYRLGGIELNTPPPAQIVGSKIGLSLITEKTMQNKIGLSADEKQALQLVLINRSLTHFPDIEKLLTNKDYLVFKHPTKGGGRGVILGSEINSGKLRLLLDKYQRNGREILIQKRAGVGFEKIINFQNFTEEEAAVTLDPFLVNFPSSKQRIQIAGYSTRAINRNKIHSYPRFNPEIDRPEIMFGALVKLKI